MTELFCLSNNMVLPLLDLELTLLYYNKILIGTILSRFISLSSDEGLGLFYDIGKMIDVKRIFFFQNQGARLTSKPFTWDELAASDLCFHLMSKYSGFISPGCSKQRTILWLSKKTKRWGKGDFLFVSCHGRCDVCRTIIWKMSQHGTQGCPRAHHGSVNRLSASQEAGSLSETAQPRITAGHVRCRTNKPINQWILRNSELWEATKLMIFFFNHIPSF